MSGFVLKEIEAIKGCKHDFYKLEIDGNCAYDEFEDEIRSKQQYYSEFTAIQRLFFLPPEFVAL